MIIALNPTQGGSPRKEYYSFLNSPKRKEILTQKMKEVNKFNYMLFENPSQGSNLGNFENFTKLDKSTKKARKGKLQKSLNLAQSLKSPTKKGLRRDRSLKNSESTLSFTNSQLFPSVGKNYGFEWGGMVFDDE